VIPIQFAVAITKDEPSEASCSVAWRNMCLIHINDKRLEELEMLMHNKAIRQEEVALRYNAQRYLEIIDEHTEEVLEDISSEIQLKLSRALIVASGIMFVSIITNLWPVHFLLTLLTILLTAGWWASRKCLAIDNFIIAQWNNFDVRLNRLCESRRSDNGKTIQ